MSAFLRCFVYPPYCQILANKGDSRWFMGINNDILKRKEGRLFCVS
ncbi:hypothetical protein HMPREF0971_02914 [Segatella oris F0302]|uniref:Uncharacterized protein n=1 Tax=Segatella oris F0302 TaxID=649760 RepID=D1QVD6_9BACT|nr:hypothetical protein HMPREF0971_02914 [Segatella oris F0302]